MEQVSALNLRTQSDTDRSDDRAGTPDTLFVINLCASMAPLPAADLRIAGLEQFKIFQISRVEDGRTRHRVRVGFFAQEADAESVVAGLRERYPTAFITTAIAEDRRFMRSATVRPSTAKPATRAADAVKSAPAAIKAAPTAQPRPVNVESPAPAKIVAPVATPKTPTPAAKITPAPAKVAPQQSVREAPAAKAAAAVLELSYDDAPLNTGKSAGDMTAEGPRHAPPPVVARVKDPSAIVIDFSVEAEARKTPPVPSRPTANAKPFHVGANAEIPFLDLALEADPLNASKNAPAAGQSPAVQSNDRQGAAAAAAMQKLSGDEIWRMDDLDSTQTIRTLSKAELSDANQPKWYVVQLALSNQAVNMEAMPQLDIFTAYRLYSVAVMEEGKILHALRLGFFKEAVSAEAVCGYVRTFFASPSIIRVSTAEQARFVDAPTPTVKAAGKVVEIGAARDRSPVKDGAHLAAAAANASTESSGASRAAAKSAAPAVRSAPHTSANSEPGKTRENGSALDAKLRQAAREIALTQSGMHKIKNNSSLLSRLVGRLKG